MFRALKLAGAAYLVYLGAQSLYAALARRGTRAGASSGERARPRRRRAFRQGVLSNLGNPKMAVFFASLLPQFAPGGSASFVGLLALGLLFCALTFAWLTFYAVAVARLGRLLTGTVRRVLDAVTGVVLVVFGVRLAAEDALAHAREAVHGLEELLALRLRFRRIAGGERAGDAVVHVVVEDPEGEALERRVHRGDLREDVDAVAILLDHPLDPAHLALDAVEPADERVLVCA